MSGFGGCGVGYDGASPIRNRLTRTRQRAVTPTPMSRMSTANSLRRNNSKPTLVGRPPQPTTGDGWKPEWGPRFRHATRKTDVTMWKEQGMLGAPDKPSHGNARYGIKYSPPTAFNDELMKPSELLMKSENQRTLHESHLMGQRLALGNPSAADLKQLERKSSKKGFAERFWDSPALQKGSDGRMARFNSMFYESPVHGSFNKTYNKTPMTGGIQPAI